MRKYLPTISELIDRLSIIQLKEIFIPEHKEEYAKEIKDHMMVRNGQNIFFDWVLLGLGVDGHTASLFPGQEEFLKTSNLCEVARHPETNQTRITLTPSAIQSSTCITYHVIGQQKAEIVSELVLEPPQSKKYPAAHIPGEWYLDEASASSLKQL